MSSSLALDLSLPKEEKYKVLQPQMKALFEGETNLIANMANCAAVLKEAFGFLWCGFYLVEGDELVLGPFQGPLACTRLYKGKGVCAAAWERNEIVLVPDVEAFPGHVACSSASKSEIVLPLRNTAGEVIAVLDVDSDVLNDFDYIDQVGLASILNCL
ncbi:MAG: GAF domain-containing protein [Flavobacteriales bacterium]|jgi:L-methionine (R)-S-oxide reductase